MYLISNSGCASSYLSGAKRCTKNNNGSDHVIALNIFKRYLSKGLAWSLSPSNAESKVIAKT